jgi:uncharacterized protein (DUF1778 family)
MYNSLVLFTMRIKFMSEKTECIEARSLSEIKLTNEQFDQFMVVCDNSIKPSEAILSAAKRLDEEGF